MQTEHNIILFKIVKNRNWWEEIQLAIYKVRVALDLKTGLP